MTSHRFARRTFIACAVAAGALGALGSAQAQTKLKWAHVYEVSEPYHKWSVWAGDEIKKRTNGRYEVQVFPASSLGKESDINQGLTLGTVDIILTGASFAGRTYPPLAVTYFPFIFRDAAAARLAMHAHMDNSHTRFSVSWRQARQLKEPFASLAKTG
jgi:TRAP-type C4-dicarboxylate transport system substrate-binding protein